VNLQEKIQERMRRAALAKAWEDAADQLTGEIDAEAREWLARTGTQPSWSVPEVANVVLFLSKTAVVVDDIAALLKWVKATDPGQIQTTEEIRSSYQQWLLKNAAVDETGAVVHPETKEPIPGLRVRPGGIPGTLRFTPDPDARALLSGYAAREVEQSLAAEYGTQDGA
jgi:hypothetical protein